jgi:uncharacterized LabA/DUF88 family protein
MDLEELKLDHLGIKKTEFGRIFTFVDFGNVNRWFGDDIWGMDGKPIKEGERLIVDIQKMGAFIDLFSEKKWFYYGINSKVPASLHLLIKARNSGFKAVSKEIQWIRHHLTSEEKEVYERVAGKSAETDKDGGYIRISKCNFDVELCVDAMRVIDKYDTICLFSGDSDFVSLLDHVRKQGKNVILIKGGPITSTLKSVCHLIINSQQIKPSLCTIKK